MLRLLGWALLAGLLTGCGTSAPPLPPPARLRPPLTPVAHAVPDAPPPTAEADQAARVALLVEQLTEPDIDRRMQACLALGQLGNDGLPHLVKVIQGEDYDLKMTGMDALLRPTIQENSKELLPIFFKMLQDSDARTRQLAAERLSWFDRALGPDELLAGPLAMERLKALRKAAESDKDDGVRSVAMGSASSVEQAIYGKLAKMDGKGPESNPGDGSPRGSGDQRPKREIPR